MFEYLINNNLCTLGEGWQIGFANVAGMLAKNNSTFNNKKDKVIFQFNGEKIQIEIVIKNGRVVFEK